MASYTSARGGDNAPIRLQRFPRCAVARSPNPAGTRQCPAIARHQRAPWLRKRRALPSDAQLPGLNKCTFQGLTLIAAALADCASARHSTDCTLLSRTAGEKPMDEVCTCSTVTEMVCFALPSKYGAMADSRTEHLELSSAAA